MANFCVGLTGGIGTGKSLASHCFAQHGVDIIDTDVIARQLLAKEGALYSDVVAHFGPGILAGDATIDRKALRHLIFHDALAKQWLEDLMHPAIRAEAKQQLNASTTPYAVMVIPLLAEADPAHYPFLNRICVIHSVETLQIKRTMARDHIPRAVAERMIAQQASHEVRLALATDTIDNNGDAHAVAQAVSLLHLKYLRLSGSVSN